MCRRHTRPRARRCRALWFFIPALLAAAPGPPARAAAQESTGPARPWAILSPEAADVLGIPHARLAEEGVLLAGQPSEAQLESLGWVGFRTVLDLRLAEEERGFDEAAVVRSYGMVYLNLPVTTPSLTGEFVERFVAALAGAERPVLVHCGSANRAAGLYAAYLVRTAGVPLAAALDRGYELGLRSPELAERLTTLLATGP